ncbi:SDR family oxidoreductase [bacterium]|nr:SDR family oxidoreductase [candidate division CSSED10-310 bacterium]
MTPPHENHDLTGRTALITGAGRGLGRAIALAAAGAGARLALVARSKADLMDTASLAEASGAAVLPLAIDISKPDNIHYCMQSIIRRFGDLDILVNNAAVLGPLDYLTDAHLRDWHAVMDTNLTSPFLFAQLAARRMIMLRRGWILNLVSEWAVTPRPRFGLYSIGKAGLTQMTRILAVELAPFDILVNGLDPGLMDTDLRREATLALESSADSTEAAACLQEPAEIAAAALYLISSEVCCTGEIGSAAYFIDKRDRS